MTAEQWIAWARRKAEAAGARPPDEEQHRQPGTTPGQHAAPPGPHARPFAEHQEDPRDNPFPIQQGNTRHLARPGDEASPRRPADPPWRGRTARRTSTPAAMAALRNARLRRGWTLTRAAAETGVSRPHLSLLERGLRRPSESVAEAIITGYQMTPDEADAVSAIAVPWAGRDSPYRTGVEPGDWW